MSEPGVTLHHQELIPDLPSVDKLAIWLSQIVTQESREMGPVSIVFMHDDDLLEINRKYLDHDTYTDIITFPFKEDPVETEIYISTDRIKANAVEFGVPVMEEALRVIAHGVLHVCGWEDHPESAGKLMRKREDACLHLYGIIPPDYSASLS